MFTLTDAHAPTIKARSKNTIFLNIYERSTTNSETGRIRNASEIQNYSVKSN